MTELKPSLAQVAKALSGTPAPDAVARLLADRAPLTTTLGGRDITLRLAGPAPAKGIGFAIAGGQIVLPAELLDWLLHPLGLDWSSRQDAPEQAQMLVELAALDAVQAWEALAGDMGGTADIPLGLVITTDAGPFTALVHLTRDHAERLTDLLDDIAPPLRPDPATLTVTLSLRLGHQFLTDAEVATLAAGDIVMLEPGPALAMISEGFAASIEPDAEGAILRSEILPRPQQPDQTGSSMVEFELARTDLALGTLNALSTGDRLPVAAFGTTAVDILIGTTRIGRGERVTLGAGHGIRILHLSPKVT